MMKHQNNMVNIEVIALLIMGKVVQMLMCLAFESHSVGTELILLVLLVDIVVLAPVDLPVHTVHPVDKVVQILVACPVVLLEDMVVLVPVALPVHMVHPVNTVVHLVDMVALILVLLPDPVVYVVGTVVLIPVALPDLMVHLEGIVVLPGHVDHSVDMEHLDNLVVPLPEDNFAGVHFVDTLVDTDQEVPVDMTVDPLVDTQDHYLPYPDLVGLVLVAQIGVLLLQLPTGLDQNPVVVPAPGILVVGVCLVVLVSVVLVEFHTSS